MNQVIVNNEHERYLFVADEIVFEVSHPATTGGIPEAITDFLNDPQFGDENWRKRLQQPNSDSRIINFLSPIQSQDSEIFSLIPLKINENIHDPLDPSPVDVLNLLNDAYTELGDSFPILLKEGEEEGQDIILRSISPNWLASNLHHGGSTGGPGSMPARKNVPADIPPKFRLKGKEERLASLLARKPEAAGRGAQVAILDTAISLDHGVDVTVTNNATEHVAFSPGITKILAGRPNHPDYPRMEVILYSYADLTNCDPYATWPHHYEMPDHGTFIASIIRAIAPSVKIYLYEVLNRFGVGSLISIAEGVVNAVNQRGNSTIPVLVMNCSFMLEHDLEDQRFLEELETKWNIKWSDLQALRKQEVQDLLRVSMRDVFSWATTPDLNVVVVAASGNDGPDKDGKRRDPRYPAAFERVLSVAALPKGNPRHPLSDDPKFSRKYKPATYSNLAHSASSNKEAYSFATFGGDLANGSSRPIGGAVGVYIGGIPTQNLDGTFNPGPANTTGWAQWSGTSFAAPIISALLADSGLEADNTNVPLSDKPEDLARPYRSEDNENVILIRQGP